MKIPILHNHNPENIIGHCINGVVTLSDEQKITQETMFNIFGNAMIHVLEDVWIENVRYVKKFKICAWSLM